MAQQVLEGTWEEIAAHAGELAGKRVKLSVEGDAPEAAIPPSMTDAPPDMMDIPIVGPPNEGMLAILREIEERQKGRPHTSGGNTLEIIRQGRNGGIYGLEPTDE